MIGLYSVKMKATDEHLGMLQSNKRQKRWGLLTPSLQIADILLSGSLEIALILPLAWAWKTDYSSAGLDGVWAVGRWEHSSSLSPTGLRIPDPWRMVYPVSAAFLPDGVYLRTCHHGKSLVVQMLSNQRDVWHKQSGWHDHSESVRVKKD